MLVDSLSKKYKNTSVFPEGNGVFSRKVFRAFPFWSWVEVTGKLLQNIFQNNLIIHLKAYGV